MSGLLNHAVEQNTGGSFVRRLVAASREDEERGHPAASDSQRAQSR